ncbi:DUF4290 domain-containing protein [Membranihabitans maritimus]|uniref:DUF4290 domain-containing protein n=1 Tax=Membranihabitans maritimus TaxID=2904244 RepID=UPI001F40310A|nr:DUF4290 domain-containing protein [Membranihabitans maritimus]
MYNFQYNTINQDIRIPEYGRHIQNLVDYAITIEDADKRQKVAEEIVKILISMSNTSKSSGDPYQKAWKHLFYIADNRLDVKLPKNIEVSNTEELFIHEPMEYPQMDINFKHYGQNVQRMLAKAEKMENPAHKTEYIKLIGSYMKMAYKTWHKEQFVNDEIIKNDIQGITDGKITDDLKEIDFDALRHTNTTSSTRKKSRNQNRGKSNRRRRK